jgi:tryptophan 2,3-dioxygenase
MTDDAAHMLTYGSYLALDDVLDTQRPRSAEHDELLFIIVHQTYELWFKQLLHEFAKLQRDLAAGNTAHVLHTLHRCTAVLRVAITQIDVLATLTPQQFAGFRRSLGRGSGLQSAQFREIEVVLGRRDPEVVESCAPGSADRRRIESAMSRPSLFDSFVSYLSQCGHPVPADQLFRDPSTPAEPSSEVQRVLRRVYRDDGLAAQISERLVDLDQGVQEWRYRHVRLVERIIGGQPGTGGSTGASYLRGTLFTPVFPDLWAVRDAS